MTTTKTATWLLARAAEASRHLDRCDDPRAAIDLVIRRRVALHEEVTAGDRRALARLLATGLALSVNSTLSELGAA